MVDFLSEKMPPAARITDHHTCAAHGGGPDATGDATVLIGFHPAARKTDKLRCGPAVDAIVQGSPTVLIGFQPAARMGDATAHGGVIVQGERTVLIGIPGQGAALEAAAREGVPFCAMCERAKHEADPAHDAGPIAEHDGRFRVVHSGSDEPVVGARYRITRRSGAVIEGTTDAEGLTQIVATGLPELLEIEVLDDEAPVILAGRTEDRHLRDD